MKSKVLSRREFLNLTTVTALGAVVAACSQPTPEVIRETVEVPVEVLKEVESVVEQVVEVIVEVPEGRGEAPALAALVESGQLPPVDERLPLTPFVVGGRDEIGVYGGEVRQIHHDTVWSVSTYDWLSDRLVSYSDSDLRTLVPNIIESWEASDDGKVFTIHLREGMKWSDGAPVTTADVDFFFHDWAKVDGLGWGPGQAFSGTLGRWAEIEIVDDYTFRAVYEYSFGLFPHILSRHMGGFPGEGPIVPSHFLKDYHIDYAGEEAIDEMKAELGLETWQQVLNRYIGQWGMNTWQFPEYAKEFPTLAPWIPTSYPAEGLILFERNPYYWKVDLAGNQLPYIDTLRLDYVSSVDNMNLKAIGGELDWVGMHDVTIARYPLYKENEERGKYVVGDYLSCMTDRYTLFPRQTISNDPVLQEIAQNPNWVKALSVAIDREEINQSIFYGLARMGAMSPMPSSKYYKPWYGTAYAQYDPDLANQLLDEMGLEQRNAAGIRLRPDGAPLQYFIEHAGIRVGASVHEFTEMVTSYWRDIGIDATTKEIDEALYNERMTANEVHCGIWHADRVTDMLMPIEMHWFLPTGNGQQGTASTAWVQWYQAQDREGLPEPPERVMQLLELRDRMQEVLDEDERVAIGQMIFDDLAENPMVIGTVLESPCPLLYNINLRNVPRPKMPIGWDTYGVNTYHPAAFFFVGGQRA